MALAVGHLWDLPVLLDMLAAYSFARDTMSSGAAAVTVANHTCSARERESASRMQAGADSTICNAWTISDPYASLRSIPGRFQGGHYAVRTREYSRFGSDILAAALRRIVAHSSADMSTLTEPSWTLQGNKSSTSVVGHNRSLLRRISASGPI